MSQMKFVLGEADFANFQRQYGNVLQGREKALKKVSTQDIQKSIPPGIIPADVFVRFYTANDQV